MIGLASGYTHKIKQPVTCDSENVIYYWKCINKHDKSSRSPGPSCKFWAEAKLNNIVYFVYTWPAVCTVQLVNTWRQAGLSGVFVDYSEIGEHKDTYTDRHRSL